MNKKGQGLPLNTIVIAILVVIVLILIVTFFLVGFGGLTDKIKGIFFGTTSGTDLTLATLNCNTYCERAEILPEATQSISSYCSSIQKVDTTKDGKADTDMSCKDLGVVCPKVKCTITKTPSIEKTTEKESSVSPPPLPSLP